MLFSPFFVVFFFVVLLFPEMPLCVLCNFLLGIAHCANAHLRSVSLLLARQLKINQVKMS